MAIISHRSLAEQTADAIMESIIGGDFEDDTLPPGRELAARYGVSIIVIREALARLQARGALQRRQGSRTRIVKPDHSAIAEILRFSVHHDDVPLDELQEARVGLEVQSARLAALSARADKRTALEPSLEGMRRARSEKKFNDADIDFHVALADLAGNRPIRLILAALHDLIRQGLDVTYERVQQRLGREGIETARKLHERIAEAVVTGDADAAARIMEEHFAFSAISQRLKVLPKG